MEVEKVIKLEKIRLVEKNNLSFLCNFENYIKIMYKCIHK
jgi:hypothetical protein